MLILLMFDKFFFIQELKKTAAELSKRQPSAKASVLATEQESEKRWGTLCELSQQRQEKLDNSLNLQKFYKDYREMVRKIYMSAVVYSFVIMIVPWMWTYFGVLQKFKSLQINEKSVVSIRCLCLFIKVLQSYSSELKCG